MFDYREIAGRALLLADEKKAARRRRLKRVNVVGIAVLVCVAVLTVVAFTILRVFSGSDGIAHITDDKPPLAFVHSQDYVTKPYSDAEYDYAPRYLIPVFKDVVIPSNQDEVTLILYNPTENNLVFSYEITLSESGIILYTSALIDPGMYIERIELSNPLEKGNYQATMTISVYDPEGQTPVDSISLAFTLIAQ